MSGVEGLLCAAMAIGEVTEDRKDIPDDDLDINPLKLSIEEVQLIEDTDGVDSKYNHSEDVILEPVDGTEISVKSTVTTKNVSLVKSDSKDKPVTTPDADEVFTLYDSTDPVQKKMAVPTYLPLGETPDILVNTRKSPGLGTPTGVATPPLPKSPGLGTPTGVATPPIPKSPIDSSHILGGLGSMISKLASIQRQHSVGGSQDDPNLFDTTSILEKDASTNDIPNIPKDESKREKERKKSEAKLSKEEKQKSKKAKDEKPSIEQDFPSESSRSTPDVDKLIAKGYDVDKISDILSKENEKKKAKEEINEPEKLTSESIAISEISIAVSEDINILDETESVATVVAAEETAPVDVEEDELKEPNVDELIAAGFDIDEITQMVEDYKKEKKRRKKDKKEGKEKLEREEAAPEKVDALPSESLVEQEEELLPEIDSDALMAQGMDFDVVMQMVDDQEKENNRRKKKNKKIRKEKEKKEAEAAAKEAEELAMLATDDEEIFQMKYLVITEPELEEGEEVISYFVGFS